MVRAKRITDDWAEQKVVREIMVFLHCNGGATARAVRIYKTSSPDAVQVMSENLYRLDLDIQIEDVAEQEKAELRLKTPLKSV